MRKRNEALLVCGLLAMATPVRSALAESEGVHDLRAQIGRLSEMHGQQERELRQLEARLAEMELGEMQLRGRGLPGAPVLTQAASPEADAGVSPDESVREAPRSRTTEAIVQQEHALFDRKLTLETGLSYTRYDRKQLVLSGFMALDAIFLGSVNLQQTKADLWTFDLTGRYGLSDRFSMDLNVPSVYRRNVYLSTGGGGSTSELSEYKATTDGVGDISIGAYYQLFKETASHPDVVASLRIKAPTGDHPYGIKVISPDPNNNNLDVPEKLPTGNGVWTTSVGLSFLSTTDPAVLFANLGYNYNHPRHFNDISSALGSVVPGDIKLGDSLQWGAGLALALNERTSMSFSFSQLISVASKTRSDGGEWQSVVGSEANSAMFTAGLTHSLGDKLSLLASFGFGLTPDAPDFIVGVKLPYRF